MKTQEIKRKKHDEYDVIRQLNKKHDCLINSNYEIEVLSNRAPNKLHDLGNRSWGKIDFLVNHCGYKLWFVQKLSI